MASNPWEDRRRSVVERAEGRGFPELNPHPVVEVDPDGRVVFMNAAAMRLFPDLRRRQTRHPWLEGWPRPARATGGARCVREVTVGDRCYRQDILWSESAGAFLVYGVDVTDEKRAETALRETESRVRQKLQSILSPVGDLREVELSDIIDADACQRLFGALHELVGIPLGVADVRGDQLASVGWQEICSKFHRVNPETCRNCMESDTRLTEGVALGEYRLYKCKNNMWDVVTPLVVKSRHVGNLFSGQFFFADEKLDRGMFRDQARRYGFPENEYMAALDRVPRPTRAQVDAAMRFFVELAQNLSQSSWTNIVLARTAAEAKRREEELRRVNRTLRARSRSDQAMVRASDERNLLDEVCRIVVEDCGHAMVWIGLAENDEGKTIRPAAFSGCEKGDIETLSPSWGDAENGRGPTGTVIRTGKPCVSPDIRNEPGVRPWREQALKLGYASSAVLPLLADGRAFGVLAVYSTRAEAFNDEEVRLLTGLADDLAYGIGVLRLRAARKEAEARSQQAQKLEAVGLLAAGVAHDFNNILASILGYNALLLEELKDKGLRASALEVKHSAEMAATLTKQLLGVSGNQGGPRRILEPNKVITAIAKMLRRLVGEKIRLELKLHPSLWPLEMDRGQLEQIVMNLAVNARDAMPDGGRLVLATRNVQAKSGRDPKSVARSPERSVVLEVRDSGTGMDAELQSRIFEPFFTTKSPGRGTGLGLSTVKSIVEEYGGSVTVESKPGRGSVFRVQLPCAAGTPAPAAVQPDNAAEKSRRGHETILVVEDNSSLLTLIKMTLQRAGYSVFSARSAEEAVPRSGEIQGDIDLLLTDVVLPDMDGPELAKRLKALRPDLRTLYMSGYSGDSLSAIPGFGGSALLEKPFVPQKLLSTLREVLDGPGSAAL